MPRPDAAAAVAGKSAIAVKPLPRAPRHRTFTWMHLVLDHPAGMEFTQRIHAADMLDKGAGLTGPQGSSISLVSREECGEGMPATWR